MPAQKRWRARTRAIKLRRRKDWRRSRDITELPGSPQLSLTSLNDSWDSLVQKYKDYKQARPDGGVIAAKNVPVENSSSWHVCLDSLTVVLLSRYDESLQLCPCGLTCALCCCCCLGAAEPAAALGD